MYSSPSFFKNSSLGLTKNMSLIASFTLGKYSFCFGILESKIGGLTGYENSLKESARLNISKTF